MKDIWDILDTVVLAQVQNKDVYIYIYQEHFYESICVFLDALKSEVYINGFVSNERYDYRIFNKNIYKVEDVLSDNSIILCPNCEKIQNQYRDDRYVPVRINVLAREIRQPKGKIFIYGAGKNGRNTCIYLQNYGIEINGFIDSNKDKIDTILENKPIISLKNVCKSDTIIVSSMYYKEIAKLLENEDYRNVFVDYGTICQCKPPYYIFETQDMSKSAIVWDVYWHFYILMRDVINKKIVLYGDNEYSYQLKKLFKMIDKEVEFICDDEADSGETKSVYDLLYEDVSELMVLNTKCIWENMVCKFPNSKFLEELGLRYISDFREINRMPDNAIRESYLDSKYGYQVDPLLGFTIIYPNSSKEYNQYHVLGNTDLKRNRILILGGSTSDMGMYENTKSWPEILYEKLLAKDEVVLFGGAVGGYNSRQECLKLLRDIAIIKPNLVISYSGVNDAYPMNVESHPFYNSSVLAACKNAIKQYDTCIGSRTVETSAQLWIRMEQTMHAITTCFGGKFIGILQPTIHNKNELYGLERVIKVYQDGHGHEPFSYINNKKRNDSFKESVQISHCFEESYMHDFSDVLKEQEEVFKDVCHLLQAGNEVVAQRIYDVIETYIN